MISVLLGLGSNTPYKGKESPDLLGCACARLSEILYEPFFSSIYVTKAMYVEDQNDFYNMAVLGCVSDSMTPYALLEKIHDIEAEYGRNRPEEIRFGPRSLDIDIEEFGSLKIDGPELQIPHPRIRERAFVLIPALEILKKSADSVLREKYAAYLQQLPDQGVEKYSSFSASGKSFKAE